MDNEDNKIIVTKENIKKGLTLMVNNIMWLAHLIQINNTGKCLLTDKQQLCINETKNILSCFGITDYDLDKINDISKLEIFIDT